MSLTRCCRLFGVSRQGLYQAQSRANRRVEELKEVKGLVQEVRMRMPQIGTRKLYYLLKEKFEQAGIKIGRDALFNYLRAENLLVKPKRRYVQTTNSKHWLRKHPNLIKDMKPSRAEEVFVSDITYIKSRQDTHYLSLVTDAYSRKIVGYCLSDEMSAENVVKALRMAVKQRKTTLDLIHHSDRGLQYCSAVYQKELANNQINPSMTDGYDCYQNALAERVNGILKQEFLMHKCNTKEELERLIKESIETYNSERPHLSLAMETPNAIHKKACEEYFTGLDKIN